MKVTSYKHRQRPWPPEDDPVFDGLPTLGLEGKSAVRGLRGAKTRKTWHIYYERLLRAAPQYLAAIIMHQRERSVYELVGGYPPDWRIEVHDNEVWVIVADVDHDGAPRLEFQAAEDWVMENDCWLEDFWPDH